MNRFVFALLITLFFAQSSLFSQNDWVFKKERDGVKVYVKENEGVYELKMVTHFQTSTSGLVKLLSDVHFYPQWNYKVSNARLLKQINSGDYYYYMILDFPWPTQDRDLIMHSVTRQDPNTGIVTIQSKAVPGYLPAKPELVRMSVTNTKWILHRPVNGMVKMEYYGHAEPGGNIPDWVVNMALETGPLQTIKNMREVLQKPEYRTVRLAHILD